MYFILLQEVTTMRNDPALAPAHIFIQPNEERFKDTYRRWQGIPSIEVTSHGRIFCQLLFRSGCRGRRQYYDPLYQR